LYAVNVLHHDPSQNGPLLFAVLAAGALATVVGAAIGDRVGHKRAMTVSFAFVPPLLSVYILVPSAMGVVSLVLAGAFLIATTSISVVMAQEYLPHRIALASALVIGFPSGLGGLVIAGLGRLADVAGLHIVLWSLVGVSVVGTALSSLLPADDHAMRAKDAAATARNLSPSAVRQK
jgi:FSR family fosmidomycin resistance protein-like MFS transporter